MISDRFPVASFVVNVPPDRLFEIACSTDPQLLQGTHQNARNPGNFFTSRTGGLLRASAGHATYLLPPEQLRRFAGKTRLYYALGSYVGPRGEDARFSVDPQQADQLPFIRIAPEFTGRALDRSLLGRRNVEARYGAGSAMLSWGGDRVAATSSSPARGAPAPRPAADDYDDGYPKELWTERSTPRAADAAPAGEPPGYEDAPALRAAVAPAHQAAAYGGRSARQSSNHASEPPGFEDGPALARAGAVARPPAFGGAASRGGEPSGHEDAPALRRAGVNAPKFGGARGGAGPSRGSVRPAGEPPGYEDAPALARQRRPLAGGKTTLATPQRHRPSSSSRYGNPDAADDLGTRLAARPGSVGDSFKAGATTDANGSTGVDDEYDDAADEEEGALAGAASLTYSLVEGGAPASPLTVADKYKIVLPVARRLAGPEPYSAVNADGEYDDPTHAAYQRVHHGLHWGLAQFTQRSGALGRVLLACQRRDAAGLRETFGPATDELVRVTTAATPEERLQAVDGAFLWQEPWLGRFRQAGTVTAFRAAQNEVAIESTLDRNLAFAANLGFNTDRALAMLFDRCVNMGNRGGRRWVLAAVSPVVTPADRQAALAALGFPSLQAFQQQVPGLHATGNWGVQTHAALLAALRTAAAAGTASPFPLPALPEMLDGMVEAARGRRFENEVAELRTTDELSDSARLVS